MASRLTQFQEFVLTFQSPWNLAGKTSHNWHQSFYVSGTINHTDADAETAGLALAKPALDLASAQTSLIGITYYPSQSIVSTTNKVYAVGTHPGTAAAYLNSPVDHQQLEVCVVAHAPIAKNSKGKEVYLRKYFHDVAAADADNNAHQTLTPAFTALTPFNTGSGPHSVVPCSATTGKSGPWTVETHLFTHQLRKGKKRKLSKAAAASLLDIIPGVHDVETLIKLWERFG
jgi:hypothetical protein